MRPLPRHWQLASSEVEHEGRRFPLRIWGWSAESAADAAMRAQQRLAAGPGAGRLTGAGRRGRGQTRARAGPAQGHNQRRTLAT